MFIMKRGTHTNRGGNPQNTFGTVMPLFRLRNCSRALAPACGALVRVISTNLAQNVLS